MEKSPEILELEDLVEQLDAEGNEYADFFRPMLGYESYLVLFKGINDNTEKLLQEIEDETAFEFPPDLVEFYICTNGGVFGDLYLYPILNDGSNKNNIHTVNVLDKSTKESIGLDNKVLLIGEYPESNTYVTCRLKSDGTYSYELYDSKTKDITIEFEYIMQLVALEMNYCADNDALASEVKK